MARWQPGYPGRPPKNFEPDDKQAALLGDLRVANEYAKQVYAEVFDTVVLAATRERDAAVLACVDAGMTLGDINKHTGMSRQHLSVMAARARTRRRTLKGLLS